MKMINKNDIKAIIFDMDGVLLDTETVSVSSWKRAAQEKGLKNIMEIYALCIGSTDDYAIKTLQKAYGHSFEAARFLARTKEIFSEIEKAGGVKTKPYARETLSYLSKKYTLALASSTNSKTVHRQLTELSLISYFKTITTGDDVENSKPHPEIYLKALKSIDGEESATLAVEDSPNGVRSAHSASLITIMIPDTIKPNAEMQEKCAAILKDLDELRRAL